MRFRPQSFLTLVVITSLGFGILTALGWPLRASILVLTIGIGCWLLAVIQLFMELRLKHEAVSSGMDIELTEEQKLAKAPLRALDIWLWLGGFVVGVWLFGLYITVALWPFLYALRHGSRWWMALILAVASVGFLWGLFDQIVHMPFPRAVLPIEKWLIG